MMRKSGITESETRNCNGLGSGIGNFQVLFGTLTNISFLEFSEDGRNTNPPSSVINSAVTVTRVSGELGSLERIECVTPRNPKSFHSHRLGH